MIKIKRTTTILILAVLALFIPLQVKAEISSYSTNHADSYQIYYAANSVPSVNNITEESLLKEYIPKFSNGIIHSDNIEFKGKLKKDIMPIFTDEMKKIGWDEIAWERKGSIQFFSKVIKMQRVKISIIPAERGGPEEENTSTFIYFRIISQDIQR